MANNNGQQGNGPQLSYNGQPLFPDPSSLRAGTLDNRLGDLSVYGQSQSVQNGYLARHGLAENVARGLEGLPKPFGR